MTFKWMFNSAGMYKAYKRQVNLGHNNKTKGARIPMCYVNLCAIKCTLCGKVRRKPEITRLDRDVLNWTICKYAQLKYI